MKLATYLYDFPHSTDPFVFCHSVWNGQRAYRSETKGLRRRCVTLWAQRRDGIFTSSMTAPRYGRLEISPHSGARFGPITLSISSCALCSTSGKATIARKKDLIIDTVCDSVSVGVGASTPSTTHTFCASQICHSRACFDGVDIGRVHL